MILDCSLDTLIDYMYLYTHLYILQIDEGVHGGAGRRPNQTEVRPAGVPDAVDLLRERRDPGPALQGLQVTDQTAVLEAVRSQQGAAHTDPGEDPARSRKDTVPNLGLLIPQEA